MQFSKGDLDWLVEMRSWALNDCQQLARTQEGAHLALEFVPTAVRPIAALGLADSEAPAVPLPYRLMVHCGVESTLKRSWSLTTNLLAAWISQWN